MNKKVKILLIAAAVIVLAEIIVTGALIAMKHNSENSYAYHLELAQKYLLDGDYEEAIAEFSAAIEIDPKQTDAYTGMADAYIAMGDYESAAEILDDGYEATADDTLKSKLESAQEMMASAMAEATAETTAEVASAEAESELEEGNENEVQEYDYNQMAEAGDYSFWLDGEMLDVDEWTINGTPVKDSTFDDWWSAYPHPNSSYDECYERYIDNGRYDSYLLNNGFASEFCATSSSNSKYLDSIGFHFYHDTGGYQPVLRDIQMGENMESVLKKLGFSDEGIQFMQELQTEMEANIKIGMDYDEAKENFKNLSAAIVVEQDNTTMRVSNMMAGNEEGEVTDVWLYVEYDYAAYRIRFSFECDGEEAKLYSLKFYW